MAIECLELAESMLEHRYGPDMDSLAKTDRMMAGVLRCSGRLGSGQGRRSLRSPPARYSLTEMCLQARHTPGHNTQRRFQ